MLLFFRFYSRARSASTVHVSSLHSCSFSRYRSCLVARKRSFAQRSKNATETKKIKDFASVRHSVSRTLPRGRCTLRETNIRREKCAEIAGQITNQLDRSVATRPNIDQRDGSARQMALEPRNRFVAGVPSVGDRVFQFSATLQPGLSFRSDGGRQEVAESLPPSAAVFTGDRPVNIYILTVENSLTSHFPNPRTRRPYRLTSSRPMELLIRFGRNSRATSRSNQGSFSA